MDGKSSRNSRLQNNFSVSEKNDDNKKKMIHKDIERQRRQEMSALHGSLRSLLPYEYIKGKRSISDHMNEAVNYVKDLKSKINELSVKRDNLVKMSDFSVESDAGSSSNNHLPARSSVVIIHPCLGGLEVVISSGFIREQDFQVSRVLEVLINEGLDVVSCLSTKANQMLVLTILSEVSDPTSIDLSGLQQKLTEVIP